MAATSTSRALVSGGDADSRFDRRLAEILDYATEVFAQKGYEGASMRDLSRLSGISLAGLYYYFESKEKLLYFIQRHTFLTIYGRLQERLKTTLNPEERIRVFVLNHVEYALARPEAMKVLSHEDDVLQNGYGAELARIKRDYYRTCYELVESLAKAEKLKESRTQASSPRGIGTRTAVLGLFGMMNWLYTWYNPRTDPDAETLARELSDLFLQGMRGGKAPIANRRKAAAAVSNGHAVKRTSKHVSARKKD